MPPQVQASAARTRTTSSIDPCKQSEKFDPSDQFLSEVCRFSPGEIKRTSIGVLYKPENSDQTESYLVLNQKLKITTLPDRNKETIEKFAIGSPNQSSLIKNLESLNDIPLQEIQKELQNFGLLRQSLTLKEAMVIDNDYVSAHRTNHQKVAEPITYFGAIGPKIFDRSIVRYNNIDFAVDKFEGELKSSPLLDGSASSTTFLLTNLTTGDQLRFSGLQSNLISKWGIYGDLDPRKIVEFFNPAPDRTKQLLSQDFKVTKTTDELLGLFVADSWGLPSVSNGTKVRFLPETLSEYLDAFSLPIFEGQLPKLYEVLKTVDLDSLFNRNSNEQVSFSNLTRILNMDEYQGYSTIAPSILSRVNLVVVNEETLADYLFGETTKNELIQSRKINFVLDASALKALVDLVGQEVKNYFSDSELRPGTKPPIDPILLNEVAKYPSIVADVNKNLETIFSSLGVTPAKLESTQFVQAFSDLKELRNDIDYLRTRYIFKEPEALSDLELKNVLTAFRKETAEKVVKSGISALDQESLASLAKAGITTDKYLAVIENTANSAYYQDSLSKIAQLYNGAVEHYIAMKSSKETVRKLLPPYLQDKVSDAFFILELDSSALYNPELLKKLQTTLLTQKPKTPRELNEILAIILRPELIPLMKSQYVSDIMVVPNEDRSFGNAQKKLVIKLNTEAIEKIDSIKEIFTEFIYSGDLIDITEPVSISQPRELMIQKLTLGKKFNYLTKDSLIFDKSILSFSVSREPENGEYLLVKKFDYR